MHIPNLLSQAEFSDSGPNKKVLYDSPELASILISLKGGQEIPRHTVSSEVVMHVVTGNGNLYVGNDEPGVKTGSLVVCKPNEAHGMKAGSDMVVLVAKVPGH